jgi:hypothetical protein
MTSWLRMLSARLITRHRIGSRILQTRAWAWSAAETDTLAEKKQCLEAIVALELGPDWVQAAPTRAGYRWRRGTRIATQLSLCQAGITMAANVMTFPRNSGDREKTL